MKSIRYDAARARKSQRYGKEKGIRVFIAAEELEAAGIDPNGEPPDYRVWGRRGGSVLVRLYKD